MENPKFKLGYTIWLLRLTMYGVLSIETAKWLIAGEVSD